MVTEIEDKLQKRITRLEELLQNCRELTWERSQKIIELRKENEELKNILKNIGYF